RWVKMLREYLPKCGITLSENPSVLNVGCGNNVKWNYLGVTLYLADQGLGMPYYVGVDKEEGAFAGAKEALEGLVSFVVGDAQKLTHFLTGTYQIAILEHPNFTTSPKGSKVWQKILQETAKLLDVNGAIILTSFWLNDHMPALVAVERAGYDVLYNGRNKFPGKRFDTADNGEPLEFDKYIIVAKKGASAK
ncbi:MAG: methyltransferase domain-containing protein, partial [Desulfobacteraceae bacterium]